MMPTQSEPETRCGLISIVGSPNVGKSTLMNHFIGQHISITSRKTQTTRHKVLSVQTEANIQRVFIDTPGVQRQYNQLIHMRMNRIAFAALDNVDVIVFLLNRLDWGKNEEWIMSQIENYPQATRLVALNKVDLMKDKTALLPHLEWIALRTQAVEIFPLSARTHYNCSALRRTIDSHLPRRAFFFSADCTTDLRDDVLAADMIREQVMRQLHANVPYVTTVIVEKMQSHNNVLHINACIWVESVGQKKIVIGKKGQQLKEIGQAARFTMEKLFHTKIMLTLWVKVKRGWSNDENLLRQQGIV